MLRCGTSIRHLGGQFAGRGCRWIGTSTARPGVRLADVIRSPAEVRLTWNDKATCSVDSRWLRDHCLCRECRQPHSFNHDVDTFRLSVQQTTLSAADLTADSADDNGTKVQVAWADGHRSEFPSSWLRMHCWQNSCPDSQHHMSAVEQIKQEPWTAASLPGSLVEVSHAEFESDGGLRRVLLGLRRHGLALVHGVPCTTDATLGVGKRLGGVARTTYDDLWETVPDRAEELGDQAYSHASLRLHTDGTFSQHVPALQVFHCYVAAADSDDEAAAASSSSGCSLFSDGLNAARQVARADPAAFEYLRRTPFDYQVGLHDVHIDRTVHTTGTHPVFRYRDDDGEPGDLLQVAYNNYHRSPQRCRSGDEMYRHLAVADAAFQAPANVHRTLLRPGTVSLVDNHRVLHGRTAFRGNRHLAGCYVTLDQLHATYRQHLLPPAHAALY